MTKNKNKNKNKTVKMQAIRLASKEKTPRLCTCGSGEDYYDCPGLWDEGWAYCGQFLAMSVRILIKKSQ